MTLPKMSKRDKRQDQVERRASNVDSLVTRPPAGPPDTSISQLPDGLEALCHREQFRILKTVREGKFSKIILVRKEMDKMVLKAVNSEYVAYEDFKREMDYNYFLSPHPNILTSYNVSFILENQFVYVQEYAPYGSLAKFLQSGKRIGMGLPESQVKVIMQQLCSALEFMHSVNLVHGDVTMDNVLVVGPNLSSIKLGDFGATRSVGCLVKKTNELFETPWVYPPEICQILAHEKYYMYTSQDVWQTGILLFQCLTGTEPWVEADFRDLEYRQYLEWHKRKNIRIPELWKYFSPRLLRMLKRLLEPKSTKRCEIKEINKYLTDKWINCDGFLGSSITSLQKSESCMSRVSRKSSSSRSIRRHQRSSTGPLKSSSSVKIVKFNTDNCIIVAS